ncbi:hypothetical protein R5R35_007042 [Gryllus longicercus]
MECLEEVLWDGCASNYAVKDVDICCNLTAPMDGVNAWRHCPSIKLTPDFIKPPIAGRFLERLRLIMKELRIKETSVWVGGIQAHFDSTNYVTYKGTFSTSNFSSEDSGTGQRCLSLSTTKPEDTKDTEEFRLIGRDCAKELPMVCAFPKFVGVLHEAAGEQACNFSNAVVLEPLKFCYENTRACRGTIITVLPTSDGKLSERNPVNVEILKMRITGKLYLKTNETYTNATDICFKSNAPRNSIITSIRLQLQYNRTAGGLTLWVRKHQNAVWPPKCVGGEVQDPDEDPTALLIAPSGPSLASPVIWCYAKNFVTGSIAFSNSVMRPNTSREETCHPFMADGSKLVFVNERASCLRCLKMALSKCPEDSDKSCVPPCDEKEGCGHFMITLDEWMNTLKRDGGFEELKKCAMDEVCAGEALWQLTDGGDCNGDGIENCDDRLARVLDPTCNGSTDPRKGRKGSRYWKCRTNRRSDFADVLVGNKTARYFCENDLPRKRSWASPIYLDEISPYLLTVSTTPLPHSTTMPSSVPTTTPPLPSTTPKPMSQEQAVMTLHKLTINPNATFTKDEMEDIVRNVSKLLNVGEQALLKAQMEANVSSLAQLLENVLVHAPDNFNLTTDKLAVSKEKAIGFQIVLSDEPSSTGDSFGPAARQIPLKDESELRRYSKKFQVEAAVILPDLPENVSLVVVTFANSNDFVPCRPPLKMGNYTNSNNRSASDVGAPSNSPYTANETIGSPLMDSGNETFETIHTDVSKKYCPFQAGIVIGCVNSHILQVGLLNKNGSYQRLPDGKHVDLIFRTKTNASLGQTKTCVYWDFEKKGWASHGCKLVHQENGLDTCRCTHLTHFAQLVTDGDAVTGPHADTLRVLSVYACAVSVFALCGVLSAGALSRKWREKKENKIMLQLAVALCAFMLLFLWSAIFSKPPLNVHRCKPPPPPSAACRARGAALHYAVLSSFCWMLVEAHTHYMRLSSPSGIDVPRFVLKAALVGWGVPAVAVAAVAAAHADTYAGKGRDFCYPSGAAFYAAVLAPVCAALLANAVIFARTLRLLFPRLCGCLAAAGAQPQRPPRRSGVDEWRLLCRKLIVCVAFTFLFGLTWYVGLLCFTEEAAYFFCVVVMLQGPALFVFFVLGEENVKRSLKSIVRRRIRPNEHSSGGTSALSKSKTDRLHVRPDTIPLSQSYNCSTNTSPISETTPSTELRSFE